MPGRSDPSGRRGCGGRQEAQTRRRGWPGICGWDRRRSDRITQPIIWCDFGSGALGDFGPHLLDAVFWGLELPPPEKVGPASSAAVEETYPAWSRLEFHFPAGNKTAPFRLYWYDGGQQPLSERVGAAQLPPNGALVLGSEGRLFIPDYVRKPKFFPAEGKVANGPLPMLDAPDDIHRDWLQACKTGSQACLPFGSTRSLVLTCLLSNVALQAGDAIAWYDETNSLQDEAARKLLSRSYRQGWELPPLVESKR